MSDLTNDGAEAPVDDTALFDSITGGPPAEADESSPLPIEQEPSPQPEAKTEPAPVQQPAHQDHRVPLGELKAERERRQAAERQVQELISLVQGQFRQQPEPQQQPQRPDLFENPSEFIRQETSPAFDQVHRAMVYNARLVAEQVYGKDKIEAAQAAFDDLVSRRQIDPLEHARVLKSPNPFAEAVQWHQRRLTLEAVGNDPEAFKKRILEEALNDPTYVQRAVEKARASAAHAGNVVARPAASKTLPSLSRVGAAALPSDEVQDMSDDELFQSTIKGRRR